MFYIQNSCVRFLDGRTFRIGYIAPDSKIYFIYTRLDYTLLFIV